MAKEINKKKTKHSWEKRFFIIASAIIFFTTISAFIYVNIDSDNLGNNMASNNDSNTESVETAETSQQEEDKAEYDFIYKSFGDFTLEIRDAEVVENEDEAMFKLDVLYTNDSFTEDTSFMEAATFFVTQDDNELEEVTGVMSDPSSNYYVENTTDGETPIEFEFVLENLEDNITINVDPMNEYEGLSSYTMDPN